MALSEASDGSNESTTSVAPRRDRGRESAVYSSAPSAVCQRKANDDKQQQEQRTPSKSKKAANRVRQNKPQAPPLFLRGLFGSVKRSGILTFEDGSLAIKDHGALASAVLPEFFKKSTTVKSFLRQLNYFGFHKIQGKGTSQPAVFLNDCLKGKDAMEILNLKRRVPARPNEDDSLIASSPSVRHVAGRFPSIERATARLPAQRITPSIKVPPTVPSALIISSSRRNDGACGKAVEQDVLIADTAGEGGRTDGPRIRRTRGTAGRLMGVGGERGRGSGRANSRGGSVRAVQDDEQNETSSGLKRKLAERFAGAHQQVEEGAHGLSDKGTKPSPTRGRRLVRSMPISPCDRHRKGSNHRRQDDSYDNGTFGCINFTEGRGASPGDTFFEGHEELLRQPSDMSETMRPRTQRTRERKKDHRQACSTGFAFGYDHAGRKSSPHHNAPRTPSSTRTKPFVLTPPVGRLSWRERHTPSPPNGESFLTGSKCLDRAGYQPRTIPYATPRSPVPSAVSPPPAMIRPVPRRGGIFDEGRFNVDPLMYDACHSMPLTECSAIAPFESESSLGPARDEVGRGDQGMQRRKIEDDVNCSNDGSDGGASNTGGGSRDGRNRDIRRGSSSSSSDSGSVLFSSEEADASMMSSSCGSADSVFGPFCLVEDDVTFDFLDECFIRELVRSGDSDPGEAQVEGAPTGSAYDMQAFE